MTVGILALQGAVEPHVLKVRSLGVPCIEVRSIEQLEQTERLIIPGGESTTMLKLAQRCGLWERLGPYGKTKPIWGVCAGSILIASEVCHPEQPSLQLMQIRATRNYYGSQLDSFQATVHIEPLHKSFDVDFIRAPQLEPISPQVEVLAKYNNQSVLLQQGRLLASSFHIELGESNALHEYFLKI